MTAWGYLRLPWKCCQPPTPPSHLCTSAQWKQAFVSTGGANGISQRPLWRLPPDQWSDKATEKQSSRWEDGWHQEQETCSQKNSRGIAWFPENNTANLSRPRPGCSQRLHWTALLCFWGCYDSQEFANQSRPGKEFCPWPQKFVFPNCLLRVPAVPFDTYQMEGWLNLGLEATQQKGYFNLE